MGYILGRENLEYLVEDDGSIWSMDKKLQYDPKTYELLAVIPVLDVENEGKKEIEADKKITCPICKKTGFKHIRGLKNHHFKAHGKVYEG